MNSFALFLFLTASVADVANPLPAILPSEPAAIDPFHFHPEPQYESPSNDHSPRVRMRSEAAFVESDFIPGVRKEGDKQSAKNSWDAEWAALNGKSAFRDPDFVRNDPAKRHSSWSTDETVKVPVSDRLFVFGSVDAASDSVEQQQFRWSGKTGVGMKVRPWFLDDVQLRTGQALRYDDQDRPPTGVAAERSELFIDVSTKLPVPLLGRPLNLEYTGTSIPAITGYERARVNQDIKFALPFADGSSKVQLGAKMTREDIPTQTPWFDRTQLYLGLELKH